MRVHVLCDENVQRGVVTVEDAYDAKDLLWITIRFHPDDLEGWAAGELSDMFTDQARLWMERGMKPAASDEEPHTVRAELKDDLPDGVVVLIETDPDGPGTLYIFNKKVIKKSAADAMVRMLYARALTWAQRGR